MQNLQNLTFVIFIIYKFVSLFLIDENFLVSGDSSGLLVLHSWDDAKPTLATVVCAHDLGVTAIAFAPAIVTGMSVSIKYL